MSRCCAAAALAVARIEHVRFSPLNSNEVIET